MNLAPKQAIHCVVKSEVSWVQDLTFPTVLYTNRIHKCPVFQREWNDTWSIPIQRMIPWIHVSEVKNWSELTLLEAENRYWDTLNGDKKAYPRMVDRFLDLLFSSAPRMQIQEYATELNVSQQYLNKSLRQQLGCSANALVQFRILLEAKNQLVFSKLPIKAIAYELGFTELANFYNFFRKHTNLTPNQYRLHLQ
ncbi:helix-turn-helix domain-containing protein [Haliscomenobacter sp.]|uniref:helix-turn-helix domain-containing protein n=1 Tax=Haliscomenobacter sp. TaxID=2717303 RepID=UPI0035930652